MSVIYGEILRVRNLREDRAKRLLSEAHALLAIAEQSVAQARSLLERFTQDMPSKIAAEYAVVERRAAAGNGVALHVVQSFRSYEAAMYARRDGLRVSLLERQKELKEAQDKLASAQEGLQLAQRARLKIEELQGQEQKRQRRERERADEKTLEEFTPRSIFAQLQ